MAKLYELSEAYHQLIQLIEDALDNVEDMTEDDLQMYTDTLDSIEDLIENKVENIAKVIKNVEGDIAAFKAEEKRLATKRKYMENKIASLKQYTQDMLVNAGLERVKAGSFNVRLQKNNPSVAILDPKQIPPQFRQPQEDKILTQDILKALKAGEVIAGAELAPEKKHIRFA